MKKFLRYSYILFAIFLVYNIWSRMGRNYDYSCTYHTQTHIFGENAGNGNLLGIQPWFTPFDFSRPSDFYNILDHYLHQAQQDGFVNDKTIVVFPEYIGTWLVVASEKHRVYTAPGMKTAMRRLVLSNVGEFTWRYFQSQSEDRSKEAIFRMKARYMKNIYERTFSELAKKYKVTIVAGSIVLPGPNIVDGQLRADRKGKLYNVSCVFKPNGKIQPPLVIKQFPIEEEKSFTACTKDSTPIFNTSAGKLAILICADSWYPQAYKNVDGIDMMVAPSFVSPGGSWKKSWTGYSGAPMPPDVDANDVNRISEASAWMKYSLVKRVPDAGIRNGMQIFLRGDFWDIGSDGSALLVSDSTVIQVPEQKQHTGQIINLWLK